MRPLFPGEAVQPKLNGPSRLMVKAPDGAMPPSLEKSMNKYLLSVAVAACLVAGPVSAGSFTGTIDAIGASLVNTVEGTSDITSNLGDDKLVINAKDDAARFVASHGTKRGPWLETALRWLHEQHPQIAASDLELAEAILVQ